MFRPETPSEEIEQHVEAVMTELVEELDHWVQQDHVPDGADDRAYVQAFSDVRDNSNRDQVALLHAAVARPHLAESLVQLNRRMDREDLDPGHPAGIIGVIVRLAMDGLWVSDILDSTRFDDGERRNEELEAQLEALRQETDAAVALEHWLDALGEWVTAFDGLPDPLRAALSQESSPLAITCQGFIATTEEFLGAAQREGTARSWVRGRDLFLAALATAWVRGAAMADEASAQAVREMIRSGWATPRPEDAPAN